MAEFSDPESPLSCRVFFHGEDEDRFGPVRNRLHGIHIPEPHGEPNPVMIYDGDGEIVEWGRANTTMLQDFVFDEGEPEEELESERRGIRTVEAWRVLYVHVSIRNIWAPTHLAVPDYWTHYVSYCVERWDQIVPHLNDFYASVGVANRFRWEVEPWLWTQQDGWEPEDIL